VSEFRLNRSRYCNCCKEMNKRIQLPAPTKDDPDYKVAICPDCDLIRPEKVLV